MMQLIGDHLLDCTTSNTDIYECYNRAPVILSYMLKRIISFYRVHSLQVILMLSCIVNQWLCSARLKPGDQHRNWNSLISAIMKTNIGVKKNKIILYKKSRNLNVNLEEEILAISMWRMIPVVSYRFPTSLYVQKSNWLIPVPTSLQIHLKSVLIFARKTSFGPLLALSYQILFK